MLNLKVIVDFCLKHDITFNQYVFLYAKYFNQDEVLESYSERFGHTVGKSNLLIGDILLQDLIDKQFIVKSKSNKYVIGNRFTKQFFDYHIAGEELYDAYPSYIMNDKNKRLPLKLGNRIEIYKMYFKAIGGLIEEHHKILEDIAFGRKNDLIKGKLSIFIESYGWIELRKERTEKESRSKSNSNSGNNDVIDFS